MNGLPEGVEVVVGGQLLLVYGPDDGASPAISCTYDEAVALATEILIGARALREKEKKTSGYH
jgi:hypothetical protein